MEDINPQIQKAQETTIWKNTKDTHTLTHTHTHTHTHTYPTHTQTNVNLEFHILQK